MSPGPAPTAGPGLYLHVPFCSRICPYCDFAVVTGNAEVRGHFVRRLVREIELWEGAGFGGAPFDTIYLGGGTPSILTLDELGSVLTAVRRRLEVVPGARVFLEANPEDVEPEALAGWRALGVSTLSLGVQSLDVDALRLLGRRHDPDRAEASVAAALGAGFETVSVDLIYALPGQTRAQWERELRRVAALGPQHLSCYQLTFHEGTPFERWRRQGRLAPLADAAQADLLRFTHTWLGERGFEGYEVSNFAAGPEHRSRHNLKYWDHTPYLGVGPSAHSFDGERRFWNPRRVRVWSERVDAGGRPVEGSEAIGPRERALEALMLGLRTASGVDLGGLRRSLGIDVAGANASRLARLEEEGLVRLDGERLAPTLAGLAVADGLAGLLEVPGPGPPEAGAPGPAAGG